MYYTPKHNDNFQGPTSFYDYTVKAGEGYDENTGKWTQYSFNMLEMLQRVIMVIRK